MNQLPFSQFDLGNCQRGDVWRVELDRAANVFLVDSTNFNADKLALGTSDMTIDEIAEELAAVIRHPGDP